MNKIKVKVIYTKIFESLTASLLYMFWSVESMPEFGYNEKVLTLAETFIKRFFDSVTNFDFISIVTCSI